MSGRVEAARKAFSKKDLEAMKKAHTHEAIENEHQAQTHGEYVGDMVFGALDGIVTTFAVVAGAAGAGLNPSVILVLGFANLFADGLSMAVGNYLSRKSDQSYYNAEKGREEWEIDNYPEGEKEEIRVIFARKGFKGKELDQIVSIITSKRDVWIDTMMTDELGLMPEQKSPVKAGLYTFSAFVLAGFVPLFIFVVSIFNPIGPDVAYPAAIILTFITIFVVGSLRSLVIKKKWLEAGVEMLMIGGLTAVVSYGIGSFLGGLVL